jgi:CheY-like chemotaxis protein
MSARILILQEQPGPAKALQESLGSRHKLVFAETPEQAMRILREGSIDLIIARVHLEKSNVFDFLKAVKHDAKFHSIPFVCFCGRRSATARALDPILARSSRALGADKYLSVEDFRCGLHYDFDKIREAVESCLPSTSR